MNLAKILDKNERYLLACSFGPDSMSLFHMLLIQGYNFEVAHVNYGLRKEADYETKSLNEYCKEHSINLYIKRAKVDHSKNIEEECRNIRYSFFAELSKTYEYKAVLVAHNEDDLIETYLLQKKRNIYANYYGIMQNINIFGINVIRPLLGKKKSELETYCQKNKVPFSIDSSNLSDEYERNKIRHNIVSKMSEEDRNNILLEIKKKNESSQQMIKHINIENLNDKNYVLSLNHDEFIVALNLLIKKLDISYSISSLCCQEIRKILLSQKPNIIFKINNKVSFIKEYNNLNFVSNKKERTYSYKVENPSIVDNENFFFDLFKDLNKRNLDISDFPITIRTYRSGDVYQIKDYVVSVRRLFIDWKMPLSLRKKWPILVNQFGVIVYIPRYQTNFDKNSSPSFFVKL